MKLSEVLMNALARHMQSGQSKTPTENQKDNLARTLYNQTMSGKTERSQPYIPEPLASDVNAKIVKMAGMGAMKNFGRSKSGNEMAETK